MKSCQIKVSLYNSCQKKIPFSEAEESDNLKKDVTLKPFLATQFFNYVLNQLFP